MLRTFLLDSLEHHCSRCSPFPILQTFVTKLLNVLVWKDIDFDRRTLSVNHSLSHITKEFHEPKTSSGKRLIVLPEITLLALQGHLQKINEEKERYGDGNNNYDLVCPTYNGNPCNFRSLTQLLKKLIKKSEVPNIRLQDIRRKSENRK